jgi:hypothetical protein
MNPEQAFERASAVFVGRVLSIEMRHTPRTRAGSTTPYHEVKLKVEESWKLVDRREITLTTQNISPTSCGSFNVGEKYLVYADRLNDTFSYRGCPELTDWLTRGKIYKCLAKAGYGFDPVNFVLTAFLYMAL